MFEVTVDYHDSTSPRSRQFKTHVDLALFLERIPNTLGFLAQQSVTVDIRTLNSSPDKLFDISVEEDPRKASIT